ncbi:TIM barrel protein [Nocardioides marmoribigeumensis]|uniref:Hydroxypyruvate isomerase n=1 Tax=Nocardioides marmoribigeumensis TaxID=433649 RepID=A0ABU2BT74_9ACTN|nr:TIM barrel protein [Nocardioides marmoribigeumensis]MDR7361839.1 hydroxypyruvate isomerase [Nocardioides marmoribigeumensis]
MAFTLAVCAEMVHTDLPFLERVERIHDRGFAVELWDWTTKDLPALARTGARFTSMTGYVEGELVDPGGAEALLRTAEDSIVASRELGTPNLNLHGTGLDGRGLPVRPVHVVTGDMWLAAVRTLTRVAELGERHDVVFCLENLNLPVDHPGTPFALAADTHALVAAVDSPHLRMNLDLYHAQIGEGNLIERVRASAPYLGEVQVADVPGRREPGTGEIRWAAVAQALHDTGYRGVVGLEAWASGDSDLALERFRDAFSVDE